MFHRYVPKFDFQPVFAATSAIVAPAEDISPILTPLVQQTIKDVPGTKEICEKGNMLGRLGAIPYGRAWSKEQGAALQM